MFFRVVGIVFLLLSGCINAYANFNFNSRCVAAYKATWALKLNEAKTLIREEKQQNPQNGITILLDNYVNYLSLLASDDKNEYEKLKENRSSRLDALTDNDKNSPWYLFSQAEVYLQWGLLKGRFGDYTSSAIDIKKARNLLKDNAEKYPDFLPDQKSLALIEVIFGALPSNLKGIANFMGMKGNTQAGVAQMEKLKPVIAASKYNFYNDEVIFFLCYMDIDILHNRNSYSRLINYLDGMNSASLLKVYLQGYVSAKTAHNEEAIKYLENEPISSDYVALPAINYLLGNAKLIRMDNDANRFLLGYINQYKGLNFIKDTYLKLAYYYLLRNDQSKYTYYLTLVRTKGFAVDEKDKQALKEANDAIPDLDLLKARFYFDGGYYVKALTQLKDKQSGTLKLLRDQTELSYRLGRIYEKMDKPDEAILNYQKAINLGKNSAYYYAANSALSIGVIYEQKKDYKNAVAYYHQALDMKNHEYQSSIDTQAKDGLERMHRD